jgi:hypothetical protein
MKETRVFDLQSLLMIKSKGLVIHYYKFPKKFIASRNKGKAVVKISAQEN